MTLVGRLAPPWHPPPKDASWEATSLLIAAGGRKRIREAVGLVSEVVGCWLGDSGRRRFGSLGAEVEVILEGDGKRRLSALEAHFPVADTDAVMSLSQSAKLADYVVRRCARMRDVAQLIALRYAGQACFGRDPGRTNNPRRSF